MEVRVNQIVLTKTIVGGKVFLSNKEINIVASEPAIKRKNVAYFIPSGVSSFTIHYYDGSVWRTVAGGSGAITWGAITGTLSAQTDLNNALGLKVDKVAGKQLSTNDYTTAEQSKLTGIEPAAQVNIIETVKVNGVALVPTLKAVDVTVPDVSGKADKTNVLELDNTTPFTPDADYEPATKKYVDDNAGGGGGFTEQPLTDGATIAWDFTLGNLGTVTIAGDRQFANPMHLVANQWLVLEITQGAGGSHLATYDTYFTFSGGIVPILSSVAGQTDRLWFIIRSASKISFHSAEFNV